MAKDRRTTLALHGGVPQRDIVLPYGQQTIDDQDIKAVTEVFRSGWLTTGPAVREFEGRLANRAGARHAVSVNSGTAALHAAMHALGIGEGDEVIVPALTFVATANAVVYQGGRPVFADVDPDTLLIDPASVESLLTDRTAAIAAVDYAGQPCDYEALSAVAASRDIPIIADASHSLGAQDKNRPVGSLAALTTFSFHPVKIITTGEGGAVTTDDEQLAERLRRFRNHGITRDHHRRSQSGDFFYEMVELGYNYRLSDLQCALGLSQLAKLDSFLSGRQDIATRYHEAFTGIEGMRSLTVRPHTRHAYHIYPILLELERLSADREEIYSALRAEGIGVNVHYIPVHLHPYYKTKFGTQKGICPRSESAFESLITLPIFPAMTDQDVDDVIEATRKVVTYYLSPDNEG